MKFKITLKIWILIILVVLSLISIFGVPLKFFQEGVVISTIGANSSLYDQGLKQGKIIKSIDNQKVSNINAKEPNIQLCSENFKN